MITYGFTMQGRPDMVPDEVAVWLLERNNRYPNVEFVVDCDEPSAQQVEEYKKASRYSRLFSGPVGSVRYVSFPYQNQSWRVKIAGGLTNNGKIADLTKLSKEETWDTMMFSKKLRCEIAGLPENAETIFEGKSGWTKGIPLGDTEPSRTKPLEFIPLSADGRYTSELTIAPVPASGHSGSQWKSGHTISHEEFLDVVEGPETGRKKAIMEALSMKDWETARNLLKQRH